MSEFHYDFGRIVAADGKSYFVHVRDSRIGPLNPGDEVEFIPRANPRGPRAANVKRCAVVAEAQRR